MKRRYSRDEFDRKKVSFERKCIRGGGRKHWL